MGDLGEIGNNSIIMPGAKIGSWYIFGDGTIVKPGAIVCDYSQVGRNRRVKAGSLVKQRSNFPDNSIPEGFPAKKLEHSYELVAASKLAFTHESLQSLFKHETDKDC